MNVTTQMRRLTLAVAFVVLWSGFITPAHATDAQSTESRLRSQHPNIQVAYHNQTGVASYVFAPDGINVADARRTGSTPALTARRFLHEYGSMFGVRAHADELAVINEFTSLDGDAVVRFQQMYSQIPVVGAQLNVVVSSARSIRSINGEILPRIEISTQPRIGEAEALRIALASVSAEFVIDTALITPTSVSLAIFDQRIMGGFGPPTPTLSWQVRLTNRRHMTPFDAYVFVDARSGKIITQFNQIAYALNQRICDNANTLDIDNNSRTNCDADSDAVRLNSSTPTGIADVDDAWEFTKATYDYFYDTFGRDGIDNNGMQMISIVRYCFHAYGPSYCPYENAFWDGQVMTYGAGFSSADDVIAHEITHGITERTANLFYYFQSGAINEAISDIFGEFVDRKHTGSSNDTATVRWYLGEDLPSSIGAIRNLAHPPRFRHPDKMTSRFYDSGFYSWAEWPQDNGGVHTNSGVANKAAYLMVQGGTFNGQTIIGLGQERTEQLWYRVLVNALLSASDYADLANALMFTCNDMASRSIAGMRGGHCVNVNKVIIATEMRKTPPAAIAQHAPMCASGQTVRNTFFDTMETPNTKWASTGSSWYLYPYATSGNYSVSASIYSTERQDLTLTMRNSVLVPANAYLHFNHAYEFASANLANSTADIYYHGSVVEYSLNNGSSWQSLGRLFTHQGYDGVLQNAAGNPLKGQRAFAGVSNGYISSRATLASLAGKRIKLRFRYASDGINEAWYGWWIDDVRIYTCR